MRLFLRGLPVWVALFVLLVLVLTVPAFQRARYWRTLPVLYFPAVALALALAPVVVTGGIDLSVGSAMVLCSVVAAVCRQSLGLPIEVALGCALACGAACGLVNGAMVTLGVLPLVATLATRELFRGLAMTLTGGETLTGMRGDVGSWWSALDGGLPAPVAVLLALGAATYFVLHHTATGRRLFAMGDNERAARYAAVPVRRLHLGLYVWSGLVAGLCGASLVLRYGEAKADAERSWELLAIACVVMGGVRVTGGAGHVGGVAVGAVTVCSLQAGLTDIASEWRDIVLGAVLVALALVGEAGARLAARRGAAS